MATSCPLRGSDGKFISRCSGKEAEGGRGREREGRTSREREAGVSCDSDGLNSAPYVQIAAYSLRPTPYTLRPTPTDTWRSRFRCRASSSLRSSSRASLRASSSTRQAGSCPWHACARSARTQGAERVLAATPSAHQPPTGLNFPHPRPTDSLTWTLASGRNTHS